ncbi:MAG: NfeD family protein, partial [Planctomycetota bacterium]
MDPGYYALLLLAVGLAVLVVEVFIPSGGLLGILCLCCLGGSVMCAVWQWWGTNPLAFWAYIGGVVVLIPSTLGGSFFMLPRTAFGRRLLQEPPTPEETASFTEERAALAAAVGRSGVTLTLHTPGGMVEVDGVRHHAEARGPMLDPGEAIRVVGSRGNRLLVRRDDEAVPTALEPAAKEENTVLMAAAPEPVATVVDAAADRPGGRLSADAPVGYAAPTERVADAAFPPEAAEAPAEPGPSAAPFTDASPPATVPAESDAEPEVNDPFAEDAERD